MIIDKFHISLFNVLDEIIYIYDYKTLEVLFINDKAKKKLGINNNIPLSKDIYNNTFFMNKNVLKSELLEEQLFVEFENEKFIINRSPAIYNNRSTILCICKNLKENEPEKENNYIEMKEILIKSISVLNKDEELFRIMYELLETLGLYYNADRCYIDECITSGEKNNNIYHYEWNRLRYLETLSEEVATDEEIYKWDEIIEDNEIKFIDDVEFLKNIWPKKYDYLKENEVNNLLIAKMKFLDNPVGFICIENVVEHLKEIDILKSLIYFILNEFKRRKISKRLTFMSFHDAFTGLKNRNKYVNYLETVRYSRLKSVGVAFININGLKVINDIQGHQFGDRAIKEVSDALKKYFRKDDTYRIGGDEFVIISENITKETFFQKINAINRHFLELMEYSISIGYLWKDKNLDITSLAHKAYEHMYQAKKAFYDHIKKHNVEIFSSMATESEYGGIGITLGHDTELDFSTNKYVFQTKQDIFNFKVKQMLLKSKNDFVMIMIDINNFKSINEMYGFDKGNDILLKINNVINKLIFGKGVCCHSYSDVYYFCFESETDKNTENILREINSEINTVIPNIKIVLSYGVYRISHKDKELPVQEIIEKVGYAHKISKKDSTRNITFYDDTIKINMLNEKQIENDMDKALLNDEFKLYLQPKYNIYENKINGAEALVRWQHSEKGLMMPDKFIPIFEKNGFILKLDMYILEQVCKFLKNNKDKGRENIPISVNISKLNFRRPMIKEHIMGIINKYDVDPKYIELEITESLMAEDSQVIIDIIEDFKKENVRISMDDFGTGYSSLNMLQNLPVDVLKIDCGFFRNFEKTKKNSAIIKCIIMLAKELEISVVAEGVETKEEVDYLKEVGCSTIQGYYFSKPISLDEFEKKAFFE